MPSEKKTFIDAARKVLEEWSYELSHEARTDLVDPCELDLEDLVDRVAYAVLVYVATPRCTVCSGRALTDGPCAKCAALPGGS